MSKRLKIALIIIITFAAILVGGFFIYVSDFYRADDVAIEVMQSDSEISIQDNYIVLSPAVLSDTALIFYPGAIIMLCMLYPWFYESLSIKSSNIRYLPVFVAFAAYLGLAYDNLESLLGVNITVFLFSVSLVIFAVIRLITDHRPTYEKERREKLRKLQTK